MLKSSVTILFFCFALVLNAQPKGFKNSSDEAAFRNKFAATAATTHSIKSTFVQEKNMTVLSEKIVSKGEFYFKKPNMVRMEYMSPFKYLMVINKDKVTIRDSQKTNTFSAKNNKLFELINQIIIDCVQGTALNNKNFSAKILESDKFYLLSLTPLKKELKEYFAAINIYIDKKDYAVHKMDMLEPSGDNTVITFENKQYNVQIPDAVFTVK